MYNIKEGDTVYYGPYPVVRGKVLNIFKYEVAELENNHTWALVKFEEEIYNSPQNKLSHICLVENLYYSSEEAKTRKRFPSSVRFLKEEE